MHWNYRVIKHEDGYLAIHEVYFNDLGKVSMYTEKPCGFGDETLEGLAKVLEMVQRALSEPVLNVEDLPGYVK